MQARVQCCTAIRDCDCDNVPDVVRRHRTSSCSWKSENIDLQVDGQRHGLLFREPVRSQG